MKQGKLPQNQSGFMGGIKEILSNLINLFNNPDERVLCIFFLRKLGFIYKIVENPSAE